MAKLDTPAVERYAKKHEKRKKRNASSPGREAWKRLRRNRTAMLGLVILVALVFVAIFANLIAPYPYQEQIYADAYQKPNSIHLFGTDNYGRDLFSRCVFGTRYSLILAVVCVLAAFFVGGTLGIIAGYFGGRTDNVIMRFMDMFQSIPQVLLAICMAASLGNGIPQMIVAITIATMPTTAKNSRAALLTVKNAEYVESSRAIGVKSRRMIMKHMLPNTVGVIVVFLVSLMGASINIMASLSYLGVGISPPTPEWGLILAGNKQFFTSYSYMVLFPAAMIMLTILAFNMLGDGLRDALDPRLK